MGTGLKAIMIGLSIMVVAGLSTLLFFAYKRVERTSNLSVSRYEEQFELQDVAALDGETVSAAEAISIARKYRSSSCRIGMNGVTIAGPISRATFKDSTNWVVNTEIDSNDVCVGIDFQSPNGLVAEPSTAEEAKNAIAGVIGCGPGDNWNTILSKLQGLKNSEKYKKDICDILAISRDSTWESVVEKMKDLQTSSMSSTNSALTGEKFSLESGRSQQFKTSDPSYAYVVAGVKKGFISFSEGSYGILGDFEPEDITVDLINHNITNNTNTIVSFTLVS